MSLALNNITGPFFHPDEKIMKEGLEASRKSARGRMILPVHRTQDALVQRMLNFLQPGTYIRPHMHPLDHAVESIIIIQGALSFFIYDDAGNVKQHFYLNNKDSGSLIDIEPRIWHSFIVTSPDTVIFEVKRGPYNSQTDKTFAGWAPEEGSDKANDFLLFLEQITLKSPTGNISRS